MKQVQNIKDNSKSSKVKNRTCYTCREKGHLGKNCPKGKSPNSNLVHYDFTKLSKDQVGTYAIRVINSPRTSVRAIWVPKHLVSNLDGPTRFGYQKARAKLVGPWRCIEGLVCKKNLYISRCNQVQVKIEEISTSMTSQ